MSVRALLVANNILRRAFDEQINVSPMKLQRLLYFTAAEYAQSKGETLFREQFEAWEYGAVIRVVYDKFSVYHDKPIRRYSKDAAGNANMVAEASNEALHVALNIVWRDGRDRTAVELSRINCQEGSPWFEVYGKEPIIDNAKLGDFTLRNNG